MKTEYTAIGVNGVSVISKEEALNNKTENIYYLDGLPDDYIFEKGKRAKDDDIKIKSFFVLDIDLRNNCDFDVTNDDIVHEGLNFVENLENDDEYFGEWSKIVYTGNGLHIYFSGIEKEFTKNEYSLGVERIYRQWDNYMGAKEYYCDHSCKNLARILRLPGSINQKNGAVVKILAEREKQSRLFELIKAFAKKELQEREDEKQKREKELQERLKNFNSNDNNFYIQINSIPAYELAMKLIPDFPYDGKKNFKNQKGGLTGYYYIAETNTICNGGSRYFNWGTSESCWNNFSLIKHHYNFTDAETFTFFKQILGK